MKLFKAWIEILYPRHCPVCHDIAVPRGQKICTSCKEKLKPITGPRCYKCSKPLESREQEYCTDCQKPHHFDQGIGIFTYGSVLKESLFRLKYGNRQEYGIFYGQFAAQYSRKQIEIWNPQVIIPIPLHKKKLAKRGYNQAELIASALGRELGIKTDTTVLKRKIYTKPQKDLSNRERKKNLEHAFEVRGDLPWKRILLVDDIYTTGATIDEAAKTLKKAGAEKVWFLTIGIGADT